MSDLFSALSNSANALQVFQRALTVVQNNVVNASSPGYAAQSLSLEAEPFQPNGGLPGGVTAGEIQSSRDEYSEQSVRQQFSALGTFEQKAQNLADLELNFNVSSDSGIPGALNKFFQTVSSWSVTPNSGASRQAVLDSAQQLTQAFQQAAANLTQATNSTTNQLQQNITHVNDLTSHLRIYNQQRLAGNLNDAGLDAQIHSTLEQLSEYVNITAINQANGSVTVLMGGQTPLVIGANQYNLQVSISTAAGAPATVAGGLPPARIIDAQGNDVTGMISQGKVAGLLDVRNNVLPSLAGGAYQQGSLNQLAQGVADRVNQILGSGNISDGPPPVTGIPLFTYAAGSPSAVAHTLSVNSAMTPGQLAAIDPGPPYVSNGIALRLAALASPQNAADEINGFSYAEFYGNIAAQVGRESGNAQTQLTIQQQVVAQARSLRSQISGVSLDAEAAKMIEFQRAYSAAARMVSVLDQLTQDTINLIPL
ncbi:MAG: flagellar hook-associated protein FlgK [Candidatus Solibacter usitatus]|nr:flagellar hook-associated protein FlgK [Candidatus Solibacter usitatus]